MMLGEKQSDEIVTTLDAGLQRRLEEAHKLKRQLPPRSSLAMIRLVNSTDMHVRGWVGIG
ncbi:hypothetical protein ACNKHV_15885 [Shigella flexneri]